ncbi:MAG TPA: hypothetical protein VF885_19780 [Arthrobacter sp.]
MSVLYTINFILVGLVALTALVIMAYWNHATGGRFRRGPDGRRRIIGGWRDHSAGRSLMGLLAIIFLITGNAAVQWLVAQAVPMPVRAGFYFLLYLVFIYALGSIGMNIRAEHRRGRAQQLHPSNPSKEPSHD